MSDPTPCTPADFWSDDIAASQLRAPHADRDRTEPPAPGGARAGNPLQGMPAARDAGHTVPIADVWAEARAERERAHAKHGEKSMESAPWTAERRLRILLEEVGEVAKEFNDADVEGRGPDASRVRAELIQVAAMAGAWADAVPAGPKAIEHVRPAECQCLDRQPHAAHEWASLSHRWSCDGVPTGDA